MANVPEETKFPGLLPFSARNVVVITLVVLTENTNAVL